MSDVIERLTALERMDVNKWSSAPVRNTVIDARQEIENLENELAHTNEAHGMLVEECERLREALRPFASQPGAISLSAALGHVQREDLIRAYRALKNGDRT